MEIKITGSMGLWKRSEEEDGPIESVGMDTSVGLQKLMEMKLDIFNQSSIGTSGCLFSFLLNY